MSERQAVTAQITAVIQQLEALNPALESLSQALWQAIDHEDEARLAAGVRFKQRYNARRSALHAPLDQLIQLLREYEPDPSAQTAPEQIDPPKQPTSPPQETPLAPDPRLEQKEPFGFILEGHTVTTPSAWPLFYDALLQELYGRDPSRLHRLAEEPDPFSDQDRRLFDRIPDHLEDPLPVGEQLFAEADLDPEALLQITSRLLRTLGYSLDSFKILLKEKKRGTVETLSIAA